MAPVNPPINPTNTPSYGGNSRPVDTPDPIRVQGVQTNQILPKGQEIGDRSAEYLGQAEAANIQANALTSKGYGDLFANLVGIGDFIGKAGVQMVKKDIEEKVYEVADKERQAYTAELEKLSSNGKAKSLLDSNASMDLPDEVSELPDTLTVLKAARDGGKITKIDYQGRLLEHAKALRAQYPGFKNEIDQEFAKVTGQNPANARINSLITDINRQASQASSERKAVDSYYKANQDLPGIQEAYDAYNAGLISDKDMYRKFTPYKQAKETMAAYKLDIDTTNLTRSEADIKAKKAADYGLGVVVAANADKLLIDLGIATPKDLANMDALQKNGSIPKQKWDELNVMVANRITDLQVRMSIDMDRQGVTSKLVGGTEEKNRRIEAALKPLYDIQKRIISKDFGGMYEAANSSKLILDQGQLDMLKDSAAGPGQVLTEVLRRHGGDVWAQKLTMDAALGKDGIVKSTANWFNNYRLRFQTNANNPTGDNKVVTYKDAFKEASERKINDPAGFEMLVKEVEKVGSKDTPKSVAESIILSAFSEGNRGFINMIQADGYDSKGNPVKGQNGVYVRWTAPEITNRVKELSKSKPELWTQYETWAKETGALLMSKEVNKLSEITKDPNIAISWDPDNKRFEAKRTWTNGFPNQRIGMTESEKALGGGAINDARERQFQDVNRSLQKINGVLYNVKNVAQESTKERDVDAFLLNVVHQANPDSLKNIKSIPLDMLNKIMLGRANAVGNRQ